jgi:hypothetical protein
LGLWPGLLDDLLELKHRGLLSFGARVIDIGEQQLTDQFLIAHEKLSLLYRAFDVERIDLGRPVGSENFTQQAPLARSFWCSLGFDYIVVDLVGEKIRRFDLNRDSVPSDLHTFADLIVNAGTTEHIANQDNAFRFMHDLTKLGGIMIHAVPCQGMQTHGLFNYTAKFFWRLCNANNYDVLSLQIGRGYEHPMEHDIVNAGIHFGNPTPIIDPPLIRDCYMRVILRKSRDEDFVTPTG